ncbi:hypothetical protein LIER_06635 [Lithospermum erythrorhizon]|uniref:RING-type E3 ubiquitin transferase n=1 Tax=Lithospermum erythrorhizon TaxID=34254 RepID=A0AAV3P9V7_LITER
MDHVKILDPKTSNTQNYIAVAVDRDKGSQNALKWAVDNLLKKGQRVKLIHVNQGYPYFPSATIRRSMTSSRARFSKSGSCNISDHEQEQFDESEDLFLPFRIFTSCKDISCDAVIIDNCDVAKALIEYVTLYRVETLVLGASSKHGLSRIFHKHDIPTDVLKAAPDFCNVYVVSKGKVNFVRADPRPLRSFSKIASRLSLGPHNSSTEDNNNLEDLIRMTQGIPHAQHNLCSENNNDLYPDLSMNVKENEMINEAFEPKPEVSSLHADNMENPGRMRIGRIIPIYDSSESEPESARKNSKCPSINIQDLDSNLSGVNLDFNDRICLDIKSGEDKPSSGKEMKKKQWTPQKIKALIEKKRLLELQMKQTMDMYYAACKEALKEKEKNKELRLLMEEYHRELAKALVEKEEALAIAESEKAMRISAIETAEVTQKERR